jgi:hypothetical protein
MNIRETIAEDYPDLLVLEPSYFDAAIVGLAQRIGLDVICYDKDKVIDILMQEEEMSYEDAIEHFDYNIIGSWVGEATPVFLSRTEAE